MKLLREAAITGEKLTHLTHTEDLLLFGDQAADMAVRALQDVIEALHGNVSHSTKLSTKIDGAPSVIAASSFHGDRFVATKGFFAKNRKIARTAEDVQQYFGHAPQLADRMLALLTALDKINIPANEIWQGDFLFNQDSLFIQEFDGEKCLAFHPNTIIYAIPLTDPLARKAQRADIGVAWHTRYRGESFDSLQISSNVSVEELQATPSVFQIDGSVHFPKRALLDDATYTSYLAILNKISQNIDELKQHKVLQSIAADENLQLYFLSYRNFLIRSQATQTEEHYIENLINWVKARFDKEIQAKKQQKTKDAYAAKKDEEIAKILRLTVPLLQLLVDTQDRIAQLKEQLLQRLQQLGSLKTFVKHIEQGYFPTGGEGFVLSDEEGNMEKMVSRLEFSKNNFSQDIVKGWMSDKRMQEKILHISDNTAPDVEALLQRLAARASSLSQEELRRLRVLLRVSDQTRDALLQSFVSRFPSQFRGEIWDVLPDKLGEVSTSTLELLLNTPILTASLLSRATKQGSISWPSVVKERLLQEQVDEQEVEQTIAALRSLMSLAPGGTGGMGAGEVVLNLLTTGQKGSVGDLVIPGIGAVEVKTNGGTLKGMRRPVGSNAQAEWNAIAVIKRYPEVSNMLPSSILEGPGGRESKNGPLTFNRRGFLMYSKITKVLQDKASQFYTEYLSAIFESALFFSVNSRYLQLAVQGLVEDDPREATAAMTAIFFDEYQKAEDFKLLILLEKTGDKLTVFSSAEDLYKKVREGVVQVKAFTLGTHDNTKAPGLFIA